ncbi:phage tail protein [Burkholderia multivorans]|uniref:phage tail protein n=1 Tax=Burkholderia multivorans TaxID=87883 RepID=UPI000CFFDF59|nr:phage tail protein [Burkholderia multivorans]MDN7865301.1 phage tail protein [Burkholderia multivorans]PRF03659.1 phage tail protein [Burkholderia multivorans]
MSAPENSNSKTPPSLLSDTKPADNGGSQPSRILADLEGRVTPPAEPPRRSLKAPIAAVVALLVAVGGWGAWRWQQQSADEPAAVAAAPAQPAGKAAPASGASAQVAQNGASAASAVQPATIVNDEPASAAVASASAPPAADDSRLSRALANGADDASGATTAGAAATAATAAATTAAAATAAKTAKADAKPDAKSAKVAARSKADAKVDAKAEARKHRKEQTELAQKKHRDTSVRTASAKDDPDADLLAALVARTKPADKKAAAQKAQPVPTKATAASGGSLAARVKECSERGFFEDQLCRWRVCDGHWGKDPACPTAAQSDARQ